MLYRLVHAVNNGYPLAVLFLYMAAFIAGCMLVFVFPPAPLFMVFAGLMLLGPALIASKALGAMDRFMARRAMAQGICPQCRIPSGLIRSPEQPWRCEHCGAAYERTGEETVTLVGTGES